MAGWHLLPLEIWNEILRHPQLEPSQWRLMCREWNALFTERALREFNQLFPSVKLERGRREIANAWNLIPMAADATRKRFVIALTSATSPMGRFHKFCNLQAKVRCAQEKRAIITKMWSKAQAQPCIPRVGTVEVPWRRASDHPGGVFPVFTPTTPFNEYAAHHIWLRELPVTRPPGLTENDWAEYERYERKRRKLPGASFHRHHFTLQPEEVPRAACRAFLARLLQCRRSDVVFVFKKQPILGALWLGKVLEVLQWPTNREVVHGVSEDRVAKQIMRLFPFHALALRLYPIPWFEPRA